MTIKVDVDSDEALRKLRELEQAAEPMLGTLLETRPDWRPWIVSTLGWITALLVALFKP